MKQYKYIAALRYLGRDFAREFDLLRNPYQSYGLNVASVHLLLECANFNSLTQQQLSKYLRVNKSYISRLVSILNEKSLITITPANEDKRKSFINLTKKGQDLVDCIEESANLRVKDALNFLSEDETLTAFEGLKLYTKALQKARQLQGITFRLIEKNDNQPLQDLIKQVLAEFGANREGFAFSDPELNAMYEAYNDAGCGYLVALKDNQLLGGVGIGPLLEGESSTCELKKMYLSATARGLGLGHELLKRALNLASSMKYEHCYLETLSTMSRAISLYRAHGFDFLNKPRGNTGHHGCDTWMIKSLKTNKTKMNPLII